MLIKLFCGLLILLLSCSAVFAQKALQLTNDRTQKKILLRDGKRVRCITMRGIYTGRLSHITENSITVGHNVVKIIEISAIGRRMGGTDVISFLTMFMGTSAIIDNFSDSGTPNCQGCSTTVQHSSSVDVLTVLFGGSLIGFGVWMKAHNHARPLSKWTLDVVDARR
jgi:hypothetical protein